MNLLQKRRGLKVSKIISVIIICLAIIPLYNRYFTHSRSDRYDFNIKTIFLEYFLVYILILVFIASKKISLKTIYHRKINILTKTIFLYFFLSFISSLLSMNISRSLGLFGFGMAGPILLFLIIAYKTAVNFKNLNLLVNSFLISNILYLIIAYFFSFRFGFSSDLLEVRSGKNIYGSNSVIGTICFLLPTIFVSRKYLPKMKRSILILNLFAILSTIWILISLSRWGYASAFVSYLLIIMSINKSFSIKKIISIIIIYLAISIFVPDILNQITYRFTGDGSEKDYSMEDIFEYTKKEARFLRWDNALTNIKNNLFFGVGLGNNYLIDPFKSPDAHNLFINLLLEQGILVIISLIGIFIALYKLVKTITKYSGKSPLRNLVVAISIGVLIFHFWAFTGGSYIQAGGIISAVKNYYFFTALGLIIFIIRYESKINHGRSTTQIKNEKFIIQTNTNMLKSKKE